MQLLTGPRDPHKHQPAFFLQLLRVIEAPLVRHDAVFEGHQIDDGKLEALRRVQGHQ